MHPVGPWPVIGCLIPLTLFGLAIGGAMATLFRSAPASFLLLPPLAASSMYLPEAWRGLGTSAEAPVLFVASAMPLLSTVPFYIAQRRKARRSKSRISPTPTSHPSVGDPAAGNLLACLLTGFNLFGLMLGHAGIEILRHAGWPPFNKGLFHGTCFGVPPPQWLLRMWDSEVGRVAIWSAAFLAGLMAAMRCCRSLAMRGLFWPIFVLLLAISGLLGFWIWTHGMVDALPVYAPQPGPTGLP
jgi:hypothetical protein